MIDMFLNVGSNMDTDPVTGKEVEGYQYVFNGQ
jgi:hypothetical protein